MIEDDEEPVERRYRDDKGQLVIVDEHLAARWRGDGDLSVGDIVLCPSEWSWSLPYYGMVTEASSTYPGLHIDLLGRVE